MILVTVLLLFGAPLLLLGRRVPQACVALTVFQIPTTLFFETDSLYTQLDSISVIGGLLLAAAIDWESGTPLPSAGGTEGVAEKQAMVGAE